MGGLAVFLAIGALVVASKGEQEEKMPQDIYCGDMNCYEVLLNKLKCCQVTNHLLAGSWCGQGESQERHFQGLQKTCWKVAP